MALPFFCFFMVGVILDEEKFLENHRCYVLNNVDKVGRPYLDRLKEYAYDRGLKLCRKCYRVYEKDCAECGKVVKH